MTRALPMSEADWQRRVTDYATWRGWAWWHNADSRRTKAGIPDLVLIRPPRLVFLELKKEDGRVLPEQARMVDLLNACGIESRIARPSNWDDVVELLK